MIAGIASERSETESARDQLGAEASALQREIERDNQVIEDLEASLRRYRARGKRAKAPSASRSQPIASGA